MKEIAVINTELPTVESCIPYISDVSLLDYSIVFMDPELPPLERIYFDGGGSCYSIDAGRALVSAIQHWSNELRMALVSGKTVFVVLNSEEKDSFATGYSTPRKGSRNYTTEALNNYRVLPVDLELRNAKGRRLKATDSLFKGIHQILGEEFQYKVVVGAQLSNVGFRVDGSAVVGGVCSLKGLPGHLVLLPYFDLTEMVEEGPDEWEWTDDAVKLGRQVVGQLVAIDRSLRTVTQETPQPDWAQDARMPSEVLKLEHEMEELDATLREMEERKITLTEKRAEYSRFIGLLYENGKPLEALVEASLKLLGYSSENLEEGDLEIDHVILGPSGIRMIGETEGRDSAAIDVSKFRQLESNINEDFEREDVDSPAKGILFGCGNRFTEPKERAAGFTKKCMINAQRLGTALVNTSDLYEVVVSILDDPDDEEFKHQCRTALETTTGEVVKFPPKT
jgi:hypothetical protein